MDLQRREKCHDLHILIVSIVSFFFVCLYFLRVFHTHSKCWPKRNLASQLLVIHGQKQKFRVGAVIHLPIEYFCIIQIVVALESYAVVR